MKTTKRILFSLLCLFIVSNLSAQLGWEKLAEVQADVNLDRVKINCASKGTFKALKFKAEGSTIDFERVFVKYANGGTEDLKFSQSLRSGQFSGSLDLRGNRRIIKEVILYMKTDTSKKHGKAKGKRNARVEVWGRK